MKIKIKFEIELPEIEHSEDELDEFLKFQFGDNGKMSANNPFYNSECLGDVSDPISDTFEWDYLN